jgi:prophage tail gpP-like protein
VHIQNLAAKPNASIYISDVRHSLYQAAVGSEEFTSQKQYLEPESGMRFGNPELPIETVDEKYITSVKKRLVRIQELIAERQEWHDVAALEDLYDEEEQLIARLKQDLTPSGKPRFIISSEQDDYRAVKKAVNNEIKRMRKENRELAEYVQAHIVIGKYCMWNEPEALE